MNILLRGQLSFLQENGFEVLAVTGDGPEVEAIRQSGIPIRVVPMTRRITPLADLLSLIRTIFVILKFRPHIVHTHTPKAGLVGMLAAWLCRVPVRLHTVAGLPLMEMKGFKRRLFMAVERLQYACATRVYPNSDGLREFICTNVSVDPGRIKVIGRGSSNGIDSEYFKRSPDLELQAQAIREKYDIREETFVVCFVGRVVRDKGIVELVRAFQALKNPQARLLLVGPFEHDINPLDADVLKYLNSSSKVILTGFQHDIRPWLAVSTIFVFPSYREGFPNVVMQAACMELACVVSDINGCNEIISNGISGLVVPPKNVLDLANAIERLDADAAMRKEFGRQARTHVVKNFDQRYLWNELLSEYRSFL